MAYFQVWEYGEGNAPRNMYEAPSEEQALKAYMDRQLFTGQTYREYLKGEGVERLLLCVKNPAHKGTRKNPNYPSVYTIEFGGEELSTAFKGELVDGELDESQRTVDEHVED